MDPILLPVTYDVPLIWFDRAHRRERLASVPANATFRLRRVDPVDLRGFEGDGHDDVRFEGRRWRALMWAGGNPCTLDGFRDMTWGGGTVASSFLSHVLPVKLTTRNAISGMPVEKLPGEVLERLDAEARAFAARVVERDLIYDGRAVRFLQEHHKGVPEELAGTDRQARDCVGGGALNLLQYTTDLVGRDPEAGRLAHVVRRIAIRGILHAIPAGEMEGAVLAVDRLAAYAAEHGPNRAARDVAKRALEMTRERVIPGLESPPGHDDVESLAGLAP